MDTLHEGEQGNDTIRRIVEQHDRDIATLKILAEQAEGEQHKFEMTMLLDAAKIYRFRLKALGHGGRFDTPQEKGAGE